MRDKENKIKILKNIIAYFVYALIALVLFVFLNHNIFLKFSEAIFLILIFIRTLVLNALKPIDHIFHGNGLKYKYQKKNDLAGYKKLMQRIEKVLILLGISFLIIGVMCLLL